MKKLIIICLTTVLTLPGYAQTWGEWFNQKSTQKKYLLEQIAALKVYAGYAQKGYGIVKEGLHTIESIKNGDLAMHRNYFHSLTNINPVVRNYPKVKQIIDMQEQVVQLAGRSRSQLKETGAFTEEELDYINGVYDRLTDDSNNTLEELETVIISGKLSMKDDERIQRIDQLYELTVGQYDFAKRFSAGASALAYAKLKAKKDIRDTKVLNGLK
jgi:hypothetical protein